MATAPAACMVVARAEGKVSGKTKASIEPLTSMLTPDQLPNPSKGISS